MAAPAPANNNAGPINDRDVEHWKGRINDVLARPSEHINSKSPETAQPWSTQFFGCFDPIDTCLITCCVPCVTFGKTHHRLHVNANMQGYEPINTSCLLLWASGCFGLSAIPVAMQRAEIRQRYNLAGSCVTDLLTACCCGCCDVIQQEKESLAREPLTGAKSEQYQAQAGMQYPGAAPQQ